MTTHSAPQTTAGSLLQQAANHSPKLTGQRLHRGSGAEASSVGGMLFELYSPVEEAAERLAEQALREALHPGEVQAAEAAARQLDEEALLTRETVRARLVAGFVPETERQLDRVITETLPLMSPRNCVDKAGEILNRSQKVIDQTRAQLEGTLRPHYLDSHLITRLEGAIERGDASIATLLSAVAHLRGRVEADPAEIDATLRKLETQVKQERQQLLVACSETRGGLFGLGRGDAINHARATVSAKVPVLGKARLGLFYLPLVRDGAPAVLRALDHAQTRLAARRLVVEDALRQLHVQRAARERRESVGGRVRILGAPSTAAERAALVDKLVLATWPGVRRLLRDRITWQAPAERLLLDLLEPVRNELRRQAPSRTLDDALFTGRDPAQVAQDFDRAVRAAAVPLGLATSVDRGALLQTHCVVLRIPQGSRLRAALVEHCKYDASRVAESDSTHRIDVLQWQLGISLCDTDLYQQGADAWALERADPTAPPLQTLSEALLGLEATSKPDRASRRTATTA